MELRRTFATNMKEARQALGWSQEHLAFESGLHRTYISGIERGIRNVSIDNIEVIAGALGLPAADLLAARKTSGRKRNG
jgi:transcriptional regulator with XRE-family HTH domain